MCFIEKLNELIDDKIPEENRNKERLNKIKDFAINCFHLGYKVGYEIGFDVGHKIKEYTEQEIEEAIVN